MARPKPDPKMAGKYLRSLCNAVLLFLKAFDRAMEQASSVERGRRLGGLAHDLQFALDSARYFGLGIDFRSDPTSRKRETARAARLENAAAAAERARIRRELLEWARSMDAEPTARITAGNLCTALDHIIPEEG